MSSHEEPATAWIGAGSPQQAADWRLVLSSQGMGSDVATGPGDAGVGVEVAAPDESRARDILRLYEEENRDWAWRLRMPGAVVRLHVLSLAWVFVLGVLHAAFQGHAPARALFDSAAFMRGETWRAWTATWLHADVAHLAMNGVFGGLFMGLAMGRYGAGTALGGTLTAGALANVAAAWLRAEPYVGLGASGVINAALGMLSANLLGIRRERRPAMRWMFAALGAGSMLSLEIGTHPKGDVLVHAMGFVTGLLAGAVATLWPRRWRRGMDWGGWKVAAVTTGWAWARASGWGH